MKRTDINPKIYQEHLESAANAADKGQAQFLTPVEWAGALAKPLPGYRNSIVDLSCGGGTLLAGAMQPSTHHLLGCDIDPDTSQQAVEKAGAMLANGQVTGDVTRFYELLKELDFEADLFVLNPPWDLHWYRDRLTHLLDSPVGAVGHAMEAHDGRTREECIDSTVASMCMALDLMSHYGEGLLIANESTLQRLILQEDAPHHALAAHVWAHLVIDGNIAQMKVGEVEVFKTGVLYFARGHTCGQRYLGRQWRQPGAITDLAACQRMALDLSDQRHALRHGPVAKPVGHSESTVQLWDAAAAEWRSRRRENRANENPYNIWLSPDDGTVRTALSVFDTTTCRVDKFKAKRLFSLNGKLPAQLVLQAAERRELMNTIAEGSVWRVDPQLITAVEFAVAEYNAVRAPLYPLNRIQRLGYLDDQEEILCLKPLGPFVPGTRYAIRTETLGVKRIGSKMNLSGYLDEVLYEGSELALYINGGKELLFMDKRLAKSDVTLSIQQEGDPSPIDYTLEDLAEHFEIPEVPDVAITNPEGYNNNLARLRQIEAIANGENLTEPLKEAA